MLRAQTVDMSIFNSSPNIKYDTFNVDPKLSYNRKSVGHVIPDTSVSLCQNNDELWFYCNIATTRSYSRNVVAVFVGQPFEKLDYD